MYMGCPCQAKQIGGKRRKTKARKTKARKTKARKTKARKIKGGGLLGDFQTSVLGTTSQLTGSIYNNPATYVQPAGQPYSFGKYLV